MDAALEFIIKAIKNGDFNEEVHIWFVMDGVLYKGRVVSKDRYQKIQNERYPESDGDKLAKDMKLDDLVSKNIDSIQVNEEKLENYKDWITLLDTTMFNGIKEIRFERLRVDLSKITAWYEAGD